jgi:signal transduction histidine kinase
MTAATLADLGTGAILIGAGALAFARPVGRPTGLLLCATGAAWLAGSAVETLVFLHRGPLIHLLLAFPRARVDGRGRQALVVAGYATGAVEPLGSSDLVTAILCVLVVGAACARWLRSGGIERRAARSAAAAAGLVGGALVGGAVARWAGSGDASALAAYEACVCLAAAGLTVDVLVGRWARGVVTGLMLDVGRLERAAPLAEELGRDVGDPSLAVAYRVGDGWIDEAGRAVRLPAPADPLRTATVISDGDGPVAALVHDPAALADPVLARATVAATRLALGNARLHRSIAGHVDDLAASARRLVTAGDDERRRLARTVEHGPVRRIAGVARQLADAEPELARSTLEACAELHAFAAGLRPRRLATDGLAGALDELIRGTGVPVAVRVPADRFRGVVEATLYFVCSEALANVAKHAGATAVRIDVARHHGRAVVEVVDDGAGGADASRGSGLRGLADRVEALGGRLDVLSPPAAGTTVRAEIPA